MILFSVCDCMGLVMFMYSCLLWWNSGRVWCLVISVLLIRFSGMLVGVSVDMFIIGILNFIDVIWVKCVLLIIWWLSSYEVRVVLVCVDLVMVLCIFVLGIMFLDMSWWVMFDSLVSDVDCIWDVMVKFVLVCWLVWNLFYFISVVICCKLVLDKVFLRLGFCCG